ncbi:head-to-tail connector protein [Gordonia phage Eyre]|uniref:Head-to-tail connector protein n=1 Tax=Gordonia phage Eyre TaxID=1887646 RepID=A0A1B3AZU0_9CAUD|nr:minor head protein [Gordonia phage Eyre]AOE44290.1 head-to-tail connector protein [Gordonia phage Eyre]
MPTNWSLEVDIADAAQAGARRAGEFVLDEAKSRAPVLSGELRESGRVVEHGGNGVSVGFDAPHAKRQHFVDYEHPRGGERLFLTNAIEASKAQVEQIVADEIRQRLGRG